MKTKFIAVALVVAAVLLCAGAAAVLSQESPANRPNPAQALGAKLQITVPDFDAGKRSMVDLLLMLAYRYKLPMDFEYITNDALRRPLRFRTGPRTVRGLIAALAALAPGYSADFSHGLVEIYSPEARLDSSNPFNLVVAEYRVHGVDTETADNTLLCTLGQQLHPGSGCGGSTSGGQWGSTKISLEMNNAKVFEILNAIVAQNGRAVWTPIRSTTTSAERGRRYLTNFWDIYPLDPAFEKSAAERLKALFPPAPQAERH